MFQSGLFPVYDKNDSAPNSTRQVHKTEEGHMSLIASTQKSLFNSLEFSKLMFLLCSDNPINITSCSSSLGAEGLPSPYCLGLEYSQFSRA